jgi:DNA-binding MarR family transcriptional regulator
MTTRPPSRGARRSLSNATADTLADFERSLAHVTRLLTERARLGDIARRSGHELSPASWALLEYLDSIGTMRVSDIAACYGVDVSSVTPRIKALETAGLVARETLPTDARVSLMSITPLGSRALESVHAVRREILADALADLDPAQVEAAAQVLDTIAAFLGSKH